MLNIYEEMQKWSHDIHPAILIPIKQSPYRKAKFAYQRDIPLKGITTENIIQLLTQLWIYTNVSTALLNELLKFFTTADNGYKYFQGTYFFLAHGKIYIIQAPQNFREKRPSKDAIHRVSGKKEIYRYPKANDRYKGKTWNQYCITQKIPLFRRNFVAVLETDGKISKVIKPM